MSLWGDRCDPGWFRSAGLGVRRWALGSPGPVVLGVLLIGDGAIGTALQAQGLPRGESPERWNLEHPSRVRALHAEYARAGAAWVQTNTFGGTRPRLLPAGLADRLGEIQAAAVRLAREAAPGLMVLGTLGPTTSEPGTWQQAYDEQATALAEVGVDGFIVETVVRLEEGVAAIRAAVATRAGPVWACFTPARNGALLDGTAPERAAEAFVAAEASVVGVNCGVGWESLLEPARRLIAAELAPVLAAPSAGLPDLRCDPPRYPTTPEAFARAGARFRDVGAALLAGCCGTTPGHIRCAVTVLAREN